VELRPGATIAHFRLDSVLGRGGMGVVWKAFDTTLGRDVALKFLPDALAGDAERSARFEREARVLASLNHPGIAAIYGFERAGDERFLVMELAEGETLASRLARGALPAAEAARIAHAIATALEAAHERGIVHRDLKPQNVQIDAEGAIKLLDFGLARAFAPEGAAVPAGGDDSPTISALLTSPAILLGTAAYMSPEQVRGRPIDRRADIWAFGVVLFEMLAGGRLFAGETVTDTIAAVLRREIPWSDLPADTPPALRMLLARCLERDPRQRLRDIGEARIALERADDAPLAALAPVQGGDWRRLALPLLAALAIGGALAWAASRLGDRPRPPAKERRFALANPAGTLRISPAISPDGSMLAYLGEGRIWVQPLDQLTPRAVGQAPLAIDLFWSPDSRWIGTLEDTRIMKVLAAGGTPEVVAVTSLRFASGGGAAWLDDGTIVASHAQSNGLIVVPEGGGSTSSYFAADTTRESDFHEPSPRPGGRGVLVVTHAVDGPNRIDLIDGKRRTTVLHLPGIALAHPVHAPGGHILFTRLNEPAGLWALPFSLERRRATGEPYLLVERADEASVADDGTLAYQERQVSELQFAWFDRTGRMIDTLTAPSGPYQGAFDLSPDGSRVATFVSSDKGGQLCILDARRGTRTLLPAGGGGEMRPSWSHDGTRIVYQSAPRVPPPSIRDWRIFVRRADGSGEPVAVPAEGAVSASFVPGDRAVILSRPISDPTIGLRIASLLGDSAVTEFGTYHGAVNGPRVSPDGRLIAYVEGSNDDFSGPEVYVSRYPSGEGRWPISSGGGWWPRWNARGDRLYFLSQEEVMEVTVTPGDPPEFGPPVRLFRRPPLHLLTPFRWTPEFDVHEDRFLLLQAARNAGAESIGLWENWPAERGKGRRAPARP
jgi:hypothetical protein